MNVRYSNLITTVLIFGCVQLSILTSRRFYLIISSLLLDIKIVKSDIIASDQTWKRIQVSLKYLKSQRKGTAYQRRETCKASRRMNNEGCRMYIIYELEGKAARAPQLLSTTYPWLGKRIVQMAKRQDCTPGGLYYITRQWAVTWHHFCSPCALISDPVQTLTNTPSHTLTRFQTLTQPRNDAFSPV